MGRSPRHTRDRIIDAAYGLFYRKGFARVSVDEIAASAGITKRTLYAHFASKDELLACVLEAQSLLTLTRLQSRLEKYEGTAGDVALRLFADLADWSRTPGWTGAGFTRLAMELADLPGHPARAVAHRHKNTWEAWWCTILDNAGVEEPAARAREIVLLAEGTMVMILIHGDPSYADAAAAAAQVLLSNAGRQQRKS